MANADQLALLRQGVTEWNAWREQHPGLRPDLSMAALRETNLRQVNLTGAVLTGADCGKAGFCGADLSEAILLGTNLSEANLDRASLSRASLYRANLTRASLRQANLSRANLTKVNLTGVILYETVLTDTNLTHAAGLDACIHEGPSTIDHRTLCKSGPLPLAFLRGCGLPDTLIHALPAVLNDPLPCASCFIIYSLRDQEVAERLYGDLQHHGVRCWFVPHDVPGEKQLHAPNAQAVRESDGLLLLLLSDHSMHSEWVKTEIANARQREHAENHRVLFPLRMGDGETFKAWRCDDATTGKNLAYELRQGVICDFSRWRDPASYQHAVAQLLSHLKTAGLPFWQ